MHLSPWRYAAHRAVSQISCKAQLGWLVLQVHWPFTDQNTAELTPSYQATWEGMEEVQREVRHLLLFEYQVCLSALSINLKMGRDRQNHWGPKEAEELCLGRAPAP